MATQVLSADATQRSSQPVTERTGWCLPGIPMLFAGVVILAAAAVSFWLATRNSGGARTGVLWLGILLVTAGPIVLRGLVAVVPGQARVIQLFGRYRGTIRDSGLKWVNPFTDRIVVSTRLRNQESAQLKVNDADGNPIEIAAVVVWQIRDTANAIYSVNQYQDFVTIQIETAVRHIANSYPYDNRGTERMSLRDNADEITERLSAELADRVQPAGVEIIESRLTRLSSPTPPRSLRPCCASSRPARWSGPGSGSSRAPSAWCSWHSSGSRKKASSSSTRSGKPQWCPTCSSSCAVSRRPSRWSTPDRSISNGPPLVRTGTGLR
jgi:hypothetical protein